jgi:hypothetical protein
MLIRNGFSRGRPGLKPGSFGVVFTGLKASASTSRFDQPIWT